MGCGRTCGALVGTVMIVGRLMTDGRAHDTPDLKPFVGDLVYRFNKQLGSIDCSYLKPKYRTKEKGCREVILTAARILDQMMEEKKRNI